MLKKYRTSFQVCKTSWKRMKIYNLFWYCTCFLSFYNNSRVQDKNNGYHIFDKVHNSIILHVKLNLDTNNVLSVDLSLYSRILSSISVGITKNLILLLCGHVTCFNDIFLNFDISRVVRSKWFNLGLPNNGSLSGGQLALSGRTLSKKKEDGRTRLKLLDMSSQRRKYGNPKFN